MLPHTAPLPSAVKLGGGAEVGSSGKRTRQGPRAAEPLLTLVADQSKPTQLAAMLQVLAQHVNVAFTADHWGRFGTQLPATHGVA